MKKGAFRTASRRIVIPVAAVKIMGIGPEDRILKAELDLTTKRLMVWKN
jgi:hypothetical protein